MTSEVIARRGLSTIADGKEIDAISVDVAHAEAFRYDPYLHLLGKFEKTVFNIRNPDIARSPDAGKRVRSVGPHNGEAIPDKQGRLQLRRQLIENPALQRHDLLATAIAFSGPTPHDPSAPL